MSFPLQVFPLIFGVTTEEEALDGAFFVGIQRVVAIRTGFSGLIPVARALMVAIPVSHFLSERPSEGQKNRHSRSTEMAIVGFSAFICHAQFPFLTASQWRNVIERD